MRPTLPVSLALACVLVLGAAPTSAVDGEALWLRYPAISPDGGTIVFSYRGDLYRVPSSGGDAVALTLWPGHDFAPVWSHDGRRIAFASERHGNFDVFVMPATGGPATRLTFDSADDVPSDFTPDGAAVIFSSQRVDDWRSSQFPAGSLPELYRVGIDGGRPTRLLTIPAEDAHFDATGQRLVYHDRKGYESPWRKHHTSSIARDVWLHDLTTGEFRQLTDFAGEDRSPVFGDDGSTIDYLSEAPGSFNVMRLALDGTSAPEALTHLGPDPVRFLSRADDGTLCFAYDGGIWTLRPGSEPLRIAVRVATDAPGDVARTETLTKGATEMTVSPNGKEVAFVARGEVFVTSLESAVTKRVTDTPGLERSVTFSPDGRSLAYAVERDGTWNIDRADIVRDEEPYFFQSTILRESPLVVEAADVFQPLWSPTGKELAYLEDRTRLRVLDLDSGESRTILEADRNFSYSDGDQSFAWSPDGLWLLSGFLRPGYWISNVGLLATAGGGEPFDLTRSGYFDSSPAWSSDGTRVLWFSNRDGLASQAKGGPSQSDVYAAFLTPAAWERFRRTKEEYDLLKEREDKEKEKGKEKEKDQKDGKTDAEKQDELPEVTIELDGIHERTARLTLHSSRLADAVLSKDGESLYYLARVDRAYDLWVTEPRTKETKILAKLGAEHGGSLALTEDGKTLVLLADGTLSKIAIDSGERKPVPFAGSMRLDPAAERAAMFEHAWRQVAEKFLDPKMHGVDWPALHDRYARFLPHIADNDDFAEMLSEMLGELNASHTGARYRRQSEDADDTAALGLLFDDGDDGPGLRIAEVIENNPIVTGDSKIATGIVLENIDGTALDRSVNPATLLNRRAGSFVLLSLFDPATGTRWDERVKALSRDEQDELLYRRWVESRRSETGRLSKDRIGYVHVRGMNDASYRTVQEEVLGRMATTAAIVVDTRFNGGGDLVDDLGTFLSGTQYMDFVARDGRSIGMEPSRRWTKPSIVIVGESNYSDAHCFPWAYQELGIGKVVGAPVPGTCSFVWWERQQDPTLVFGVPNMGILDPDGEVLENQQLEPDLLVLDDPASTIAGRDPQLERAVKSLLAELGD